MTRKLQIFIISCALASGTASGFVEVLRNRHGIAVAGIATLIVGLKELYDHSDANRFQQRSHQKMKRSPV